jgi:predicted dehydrogenase
MPKTYRAALVGCSRMGAFIDNEVRGSTSSVLPYSHAAGYEACDRTDLIAGSDLREDVLEVFGQRYDVPSAHLYTDYKALIEKEKPDVLSIATQPEQRADVIRFAIEHGVKAIYAEKALCASMAEAAQIRDAAKKNGVALNMGTNRRWHPGVDAARALIESGELGALKTIVLYASGDLFNTASHWFDLANCLNGDAPAIWVQATLPRGEQLLEGDRLTGDPSAEGVIAFANGVKLHALLSPRPDTEAICERGAITAVGGGVRFELRKAGGGEGRRAEWESAPFPAFEQRSSTLRLIEDLVAALDRGDAKTRCGPDVAYANTELLFACIESHRQGGARVSLPLKNSRSYLKRDVAPKQPKFAS